MPARRAAGDAASAAITDDYLHLLGLASHEYFHSWNVKRIKPAAFAPYDLSRENYTRQLWAFEGITSYYDDLALVRSGVIDARALSRAARSRDHQRAAHARAPRAERRRFELRRVDQVLSAGRELAERRRQLLREGRACRACARSVAAQDAAADHSTMSCGRYGRAMDKPASALPKMA